MSYTTPSHAALNSISFIRWYFFGVWMLSYKACRSELAEKHLAAHAMKKRTLYKALVRQGILYGILPHYYFKFELYKPEHNPLDYFYNAELGALHRYSNRAFPKAQNARALMSHKLNFARTLEKQGIPTVPSDICQEETLFFQKKTIFCKPVDGSSSLDAFLLQYTNGAYAIEPIQSEPITDAEKVYAYVKRVLKKHRKLLVQPFVDDHPEVKKLSGQAPSTTVRIITNKETPSTPANCLYLQLEIPKAKDTAQKICQLYHILPLCLDSLDVDATFQKKHPSETYPSINTTIKTLLKQSIALTLRAHDAILSCRTVSFDFIISPEGPVILEANYNWSVEHLYMVLPNPPSASTHPAAKWLRQLDFLNQRH